MSIDLEAAKAMLENRIKPSNTEDIRWASFPNEGSFKFRILPPIKSESVPGKVIYSHWGLSDDEGNLNRRVTCLKTYKMDCPICEMLEKYQERLDISDWSASGRSYFNALIYNEKDYDSSLPYVLGSSDYTFYWLLEKIIDPEIGDITDPANGHNITFKRKVFKGAFERTISLKPTPIADSEDEIKEILDKCYDLSKIWKNPDDEFIKFVTDTANKTETAIKDRILVLGNKSDSPPNDNSEKTEEKEKQTESNSTSESSNIKNTKVENAPKGAPECFGIDWDSDLQKCQVCPHEFLCQTTKEEK